MKHIKLNVLAFYFLGTWLSISPIAHAQGAGIEWDTLCKVRAEVVL